MDNYNNSEVSYDYCDTIDIVTANLIQVKQIKLYLKYLTGLSAIPKLKKRIIFDFSKPVRAKRVQSGRFRHPFR